MWRADPEFDDAHPRRDGVASRTVLCAHEVRDNALRCNGRNGREPTQHNGGNAAAIEQQHIHVNFS